MTEIKYEVPQGITKLGDWQVEMAKNISANHNIKITDIQRELSGSVLVINIKSDLSDAEVDNIKNIIESYLPANAINL